MPLIELHKKLKSQTNVNNVSLRFVQFIISKGQENGNELLKTTEDILGDGNDMVEGNSSNSPSKLAEGGGIIKVVHLGEQGVDTGQDGLTNEETNEEGELTNSKKAAVTVATKTYTDKSSYGFHCDVCSKVFSTKGI